MFPECFPICRHVLPTPHNKNVQTPHWRRYVKTYTVDMNTSCTPEEGAHSPSGPNRLVIIIIIIIIIIFLECSLNVTRMFPELVWWKVG
jgi:hypothetical protein